MKVRSLEEICLFSLPTKESEIIDFFLGTSLKDEVLKIKPVQNQTHAGQRTKFKVFVASGDYNMLAPILSAPRRWPLPSVGHHPGQALHRPCAMSLLGNKIGRPHTVPCKVPGCCGSVLVYLSPATGALASSLPLRPRSCCLWLALTAIPPLGAARAAWAT